MDSHRNYQYTSFPSEYWTNYSDSSYDPQNQAVQSQEHDPRYLNQSPEGTYCHNVNITNTHGRVNTHQRFYPSSYLQDSSSSFQASPLTCPVTTRVHINPNYRPTQQLIPELYPSAKRPTSVHINPHWKGRPEPASTTTANGPNANSNHGFVSKKTIFINPKVLAQHKLDVPNTMTGWFQKPLQTKSPDPQDEHAFGRAKCEAKKVSLSNPKAQDVERGNVQRRVVVSSAQNPAFITVSSTKLIRRASPCVNSQQPKSNEEFTQSPHLLHSMESGVDKMYVRPVITNSLSLKVAKQVCSKYKLVRHSPSALNASKLSSSGSADPLRKLRRKSFNSKLPLFPSTKSAYKFVRKAAPQESSTLLGNGYSSVSSPHQGILKEDSALTAKGQRIARKSIKSRYKLVKTQAHPQRGPVIPEASRAKTMKSRYKLVRSRSSDVKTPSDMSKSKQPTPVLNVPNHSLFLKSRYKLLRSAGANKLKQARKVSRFRVVHTSNVSKLRMKNCTSYKSMRKTPQSLTFSSPVVKRQGLYGNMIWRKEVGMFASPSKASQSRYDPNSRKVKGVTRPSNNSSSRNLLNIGGVFYRSTPTSLTRTNSGKSKERIVHIRGKKFILDVKGTTLRPAPSPESSANNVSGKRGQLSIARVDLGGVTYTRRNDNTLVRTNLHYARNILSNAKMRSIALLKEKLHKNNQPCLIFHRFGKCHSYEEGKCWRVHDPKNIAICRKFLQGACDADKCSLSHNVGLEKMPTCRYFLEGCCVRDNCPYLHVKLSACAPICSQFLHGYCSAADKCKKRHVYLCPIFDRDGKCSKGKRCPYPHKNKDKKKPVKEVRSFGGCESQVQDLQPVSQKDAEKRKRYYDRNSFGTQPQNQIDSSPSQGTLDIDVPPLDESVQSEDELDTPQREATVKRPTIGILPAYIPLG